ncbi:hypothetical protein NDU88_005125 [Pleurodeles waltl]|uniref:RING-type domain-containing protein n=1 Tax=Pleurodeles waltl TaxID=8319 RepID=A0AAV7TBB8_PLEWA|nr:hypothetical protein NDU88_005125 [Pleurodeles waltl]
MNTGCHRQSGPDLPPEIRPLCAICFKGSDPMPRMLECAHVFCGDCIQDMLATSPGHVVMFLYCPLCGSQSVTFVQGHGLFTFSGLAPAPCWYRRLTLPKQPLASEEDRKDVESVPSGGLRLEVPTRSDRRKGQKAKSNMRKKRRGG